MKVYKIINFKVQLLQTKEKISVYKSNLPKYDNGGVYLYFIEKELNFYE